MLVSRFLAWSRTAAAGERADAVSALARAALYGELQAGELRAAEIALTHCLDDPSPVVRRALSEALAGASDAPRHLVLALAADQSDVAAPILARSPVLGEGDLVDCAAIGDAFAQTAIALRPGLTAPVAAAIAEIGAREALIALAVNTAADLRPFSMKRMIERFGEDAELREAMLARADLPLALRHDLVVATSAALTAFVTARGWLVGERAERVAREARDKAAVIIAAEAAAAPGAATLDLARHLRTAGRLTPALLLRALLSGDAGFFAAALADLGGMTTQRVAGLMRDPRGSGFAALYARAGLPAALAPAFRAAIEAARRAPVAAPDGMLSLPLASAVVDACEAEGGAMVGKAMALLRRYEVEAAREQARIEVERMVALALAPPAEEAPAIEARDMDAQEIDGETIEATGAEAGDETQVSPDPETIAEPDWVAPQERAA